SASRAWAPTSSLPTARKKSTSAPSRTSSPAASAPPPPGSSQLSVAVTIAPGSGTRSTRAKRTHSTCPTTAALTDWASSALEKMMALVSVPPFESFYEENQETFLRALRAYGRLKNADNLRAWVLTIARRVAADHYRRREAKPEPAEPKRDSRPAYAELGELAEELPRKERAAVVLRYGYDLSYAAIGAALGSSEDAARQAA